MKGQQQIIDTLNSLLADELTAINQYMVHAEMCDSWGYSRLNEMVEKRAITEMKHAEKLIARILFLEGTPIVSNLRQMHIGADVLKQFQNDHKAEEDAIKAYNAGIRQAGELGDNGTRELLAAIIQDEEAHIDEIEEQMDQIEHMGIGLYLSEQVG